MPHPRKNPVAFTPPLEAAESIQIAVMNIARAVGAGQLDDRQARTMIAAIRQLRWAFQYRCEHPRPDPGTECPDAMANVLTLAYSDTDPEKLVTDSPNSCTADTPVRR